MPIFWFLYALGPKPFICYFTVIWQWFSGAKSDYGSDRPESNTHTKKNKKDIEEMIQEYYEESSSSSLMKTIGAVKKYFSANKLIELILAPIQIHLLICLKNEAFGSSVDILSTYSWAEHIFELCPQLCAEYRSLNVPIYLPEVMHLVDLYRRSAICY